MSFSFVDLIGYLAMALVLSSFLARSITLLRIINSIGCAVFVVYGFMLNNAWPIIITNGLIIVINFYFLYSGRAKKLIS
jgi:hypothetical protein